MFRQMAVVAHDSSRNLPYANLITMYCESLGWWTSSYQKEDPKSNPISPSTLLHMGFVVKNGKFQRKDPSSNANASTSTNASPSMQPDIQSLFENLMQQMDTRLTLFEQRMVDRMALHEENMVQQFRSAHIQFNDLRTSLQQLTAKCSSMGSLESQSASGFASSCQGPCPTGSQPEGTRDSLGQHSMGPTAPDLRFVQPVPIPSIPDDYVSSLLNIPPIFNSHPGDEAFYF